MAILRDTQITGSLNISGSLVAPPFMVTGVPTGSLAYSGSVLYVYNGTSWETVFSNQTVKTGEVYPDVLEKDTTNNIWTASVSFGSSFLNDNYSVSFGFEITEIGDFFGVPNAAVQRGTKTTAGFKVITNITSALDPLPDFTMSWIATQRTS